MTLGIEKFFFHKLQTLTLCIQNQNTYIEEYFFLNFTAHVL